MVLPAEEFLLMEGNAQRSPIWPRDSIAMDANVEPSDSTTFTRISTTFSTNSLDICTYTRQV